MPLVRAQAAQEAEDRAQRAEQQHRRKEAEADKRREEAAEDERRRLTAMESLFSLPVDVQALLQAEARRASHGLGPLLEWALVDAVERYVALRHL
jgi:hypothetical protein